MQIFSSSVLITALSGSGFCRTPTGSTARRAAKGAPQAENESARKRKGGQLGCENTQFTRALTPDRGT